MEPGLLTSGAMDGAAQPKDGCKKTGNGALALPRRDGAMPCRPDKFDVFAKRFAISAKSFRQSCETVCETVPVAALPVVHSRDAKRPRKPMNSGLFTIIPVLWYG
jgi:hypothetical protein